MAVTVLEVQMAKPAVNYQFSSCDPSPSLIKYAMIV